ncbi:MAG: helix-turn-helix transcriptional regulator [Paludibacteraceae bacterium]|nr:helix-turn-helix transcriptional regulator [Paludibacteraceae bacterium]
MEEMMKKGTVDAESIAQHMHITPRTLQRRMTKTFAVTPQAYLTQVRMQKAKYLLLNYRDITIAEVAEQCGYTQLPNFTRAFTRYFGMKPSEMRLQRIDNQQFITPPPAKGGITDEHPEFANP